jgi:hypothetical protein
MGQIRHNTYREGIQLKRWYEFLLSPVLIRAAIYLDFFDLITLNIQMNCYCITALILEIKIVNEYSCGVYIIS